MDQVTDFLCFKLGTAIRKIVKYYNNAYSEYGVTVAQSFILLSLLEEDGQNIKTLAERLSLDSSAVTGLVDRLEKEQLVRRSVDIEDRRAFQIFLTENGREVSEAILPIARQVNDHLRNGINSDMQVILEDYLDNIDRYLK